MGFFLPNLVILTEEGTPQETPQSIATSNQQPATINFFLGRVPPGRAFGYIFYCAPLHKRIPPLSLTLLVSLEMKKCKNKTIIFGKNRYR